MTRKVLGRGLSALIPQEEPERFPPAVVAAAVSASTQAVQSESQRGAPFRVAIESIVPSDEQPRKRFDVTSLATLIESIARDGVLQPLLVRERPASEGGGYILIAGERRWRAAQRAGLHEVPVVVREATAREAFELALIENLQREDLNPIEEAEGYARLIEEHGMTQEQAAERVGKDRTTVTNALRLLKLPPPVRTMVERGHLSMGQARALLGLPKPSMIEVLARKVAEQALSVRQVEALVARQKREELGAAPPAPTKASASVRDLETRLERALGSKVRVVDQKGKGRIEIDWSSLDELDRLLERLLGTPS